MASAIFGWISSVIRSSFHPIASAIIEIDSASPTCRTLPSSTFVWNCSGVSPAPIFCWNGSRRIRASWIAVDVDRVDALADAGQRDRQRVHHEAGIDAGAEHRDLGLLGERVDRRARIGCCALVG